VACASVERTNKCRHTEAYVIGRKIIEEAGGIEAYNQRARKKWGLTSPVIEAKDNPALVFED
jgi:hypothetical protein